jgi:hypothetical protein
VNSQPRWSRQRYLEERGKELEQLERETRRAERRLLVQTLFGCACCSAVGLSMVTWSFHTTRWGVAAVAFWSGLLIGDAGMLTLLLRHYARTVGSDD